MSEFDLKLRWNIPSAPLHKGVILCGANEFQKKLEQEAMIQHYESVGFRVQSLNPADASYVEEVLNNYSTSKGQDTDLFFSDEENLEANGTLFVFENWDEAKTPLKNLSNTFILNLNDGDVWLLNVRAKKSIPSNFKPSLPILEYPELKPWRLGPWLSHRAKSYGLHIEDRLADDIINNYGSDMTLLDNDLQKAAILLKDVKGTSYLSPADAMTCFTVHEGMKPWKFSEAWQMGHHKMCLQILKKLFNTTTNDPSMLLTKILANKIERLLWARELYDKLSAKPSGLTESDWDQVITKSGLPARFPAQKEQAKAIIQKRSKSNLIFSYTFLHTIETEIRRGYPAFSRYLLWLGLTEPSITP